MFTDNPMDKIKACIWGGVYGDTLGSVTEGKTSKEISEKWPYGLPGLINKVWTDDTEMTLALMQAITEVMTEDAKHDDLDITSSKIFTKVGKKTKTNTNKHTTTIKDVVTITAAHNNYCQRYNKNKKGYSRRTSETLESLSQVGYNIQPRHSRHNGSIMRISPLGVIPRSLLPLTALKKSICNALYYTHKHDDAYTCCYILCRIIHELIYENMDVKDVMGFAQKVASEVKNTDIFSKLKLVEMALLYKPNNITEFLTGHVDNFQILAVDALCCALYIFITNKGKPLRAVSTAATLGGDTDTIAKIVGDLCGSCYGSGWIPQDFNSIDGIDEVISLTSNYCHIIKKLNNQN